MSGETDLIRLLAELQPELQADTYVFCSIRNASYPSAAALQPLASFQEAEGLSLVLTQQAAEAAGLACDSQYRCITLTVHSSLEAVGLTAAVATRLAQAGISANVIAATHHDHVFVPAHQAAQALAELLQLQSEAAA
jgi:hypothetical protein